MTSRIAPLARWTVCIAALLAAALPVRAWNSDGHRLVARIAADELGPQARAQVERLFAQPAREALVGQALWADAITASRPETRPWHYVNIPRRADGFDWLRDCAGGACVVGALKAQWARLSDPAEPDAARREALAFVVHLVADLHQPLHCGDGQDRGGNDIIVEAQGVRTNLHRVWDGEFFPWKEWQPAESRHGEAADASPEDEAADALPEDEAAVPDTRGEDSFDSAVVAAWAEQSHRLAVERVYERLPATRPDGSVAIGSAQLDSWWALAREQVVRAGRRLAGVLDAVFRTRPSGRAPAGEETR